MEKKDLKDGMIVRCNNNKYYLVLNKRLISETGFIELSEYDENLQIVDPDIDSEVAEQYTIDEIFAPNDRALSLNELIIPKYLLWKRSC